VADMAGENLNGVHVRPRRQGGGCPLWIAESVQEATTKTTA